MTMNDHDKRLFRYLIIFMAVWLILLTAIPSIFYTVLPLDTIETIMWSHPFSMGNAKHPPLAAWLAGIFTIVFAHTDFAMYLLEVGHVATVGGDAFGAPECFRMSYATSDENICEALRRIKEALAKLK